MKKNNKAFTLVETLVAIAIFSISIIAVMSVLARGISDTSYAKQKLTATFLAQEGIEYIRNMRDTHTLYYTNRWNNTDPDNEGFINKLTDASCNTGCGFYANNIQSGGDDYPLFACTTDSSNPCKLSIYNGNYGGFGLGPDSGFIRTIEINDELNDDGNEIQVLSTVSWMQGSGSHSITFSTSLFNWIK